jgi:hypothetical protein
MALPRYFMNVRYRDRLFVDEEGDELASEHAVHGHALDTARDLIAHAWMDTIRNWFDCSFEVTNEAGQVVLVMPSHGHFGVKFMITASWVSPLVAVGDPRSKPFA